MTKPLICVCVGRGRHKHMIAEHRYLAEQGVKLVELRVDYIRSRLNVQRLLNDRLCPCIITCRREQDGGQWEGTEEQRLMTLRTAIVEGADYVDLEEDVADKIPRYGKTKRIVSYHNFRECPEDLEEIHKKMCTQDADVVKMAVMTHRTSDNLRILRIVQSSEVPTVGICMGEVGMPTRVLQGRFGAPFTYATLHHEREMAPGQISFKQMQDVYRFEDIDTETKVYGMVADPVSSSLSPIVHNAALKALGMNAVYVPFRIPRDDLQWFLDDCEELGIQGLSVGVPHKEGIVRHLSKADGAVRGIGSANTVVFEGDQAVGYNTDHKGFLDALDQVFAEHERGMDLGSKSAMILGAGGLSKALVYGLKKRNADVMISSQNYERARDIAERFQCRAIQWYERTRMEPDILVNATPIGMHPNVDESAYDRKFFERTMIIFDTVHYPERTLMIKHARDVGCRTITGVELFVRQAALQFELFTKQSPPLDLMREEFRKAIGAAQR